MILKDISFATPQENILFDEVLLSLAEQGALGEVLRFWESPIPFIVLGKISHLMEEVDVTTALRDGVSVLRRFSGGGTILQGKGCLNYTLILSKELHPDVGVIKKSYEFILGEIVEGLKTLHLPVRFKPISDIVLGEEEKKFSGNAQHRLKKFVLHHGTLLYNFNMAEVEKYLKFPQKVPEYRRGRSHSDFLINLPCSNELLKKIVCEAFQVNREHHPLTQKEHSYLEKFLQTKKVAMDLRSFLCEAEEDIINSK